jgi:hypothetical protein
MQSSASDGQGEGVHDGSYVELDFSGGGSWFHRSDGAENRQNRAASRVEDHRGVGSARAASQRQDNDGEQ